MAIFIIVFTFALIVVAMSMIHEERMKRIKIEAALREAEMERGYAPGTYSRTFSSKKAYKDFKKDMKKGTADNTFSSEQAEREALEKGIKDLEKRIENIDLIMKERKKEK